MRKLKSIHAMFMLGCIAFTCGSILCILNLSVIEYNPPLLTVLQMALFALMIGVPFFVLFILFFEWRKHIRWVLLPILVSGIFLYLIRESSFAGQRMRVRIFESQKKEYMPIVCMLYNGTIPLERYSKAINIPEQHNHLVGQIYAEKNDNGSLVINVLVSGGFPPIYSRYVYHKDTNYSGDLAKGDFVFDHPGWHTSR